MHVYGELTGVLTPQKTIVGALTPLQKLQGKLTIPSTIDVSIYGGAYTVTPSEETQTLETGSLYMRDNITINPIPSNYGLITWNGVTLTVS